MAAKDTGKAFLEQVLAKVPETSRASVQAALENDDLLSFMGDQVMLRPEFSRAMDQLRVQEASLVAKHNEHDNWYKGQKGLLTAGANALARLKALKRRGVIRDDDPDPEPDDDDDDDGDPAPASRRRASLPDNVVTQDKLDAVVTAQATLEQQGVRLMSAINKLGMTHFKEFGEPLDTDELIAAAGKSGRTLADEYQVMVAPRREETAKKKQEEEIKAAEERGKAAARAELANQSMPYEVSVSEPGTGTLSLLKAEKPSDGLSTVERAAREWNQRRRGVTLGGS